MRILPPALAGLLAIALLSSARADVLLLRDGRLIEGHKLSRTGKGINVYFVNGEVLIPAEMVEDAVIEGEESAFEPRTPQEREKVEKGLVPFEGKWMKPSRRDSLIRKKIEAKKAVMEEVKKHSEWRDRWKETTKHFEFEYTVPPHIHEYYRGLMEAYYSVFAKTWKIKQPKERGKLTVCFYSNLKEFGRTGGARGGVRGYFKFGGNWELNFYYDRGDPRYTEEVMFHETNHYLQLLLDPDFSMPHFPGESLAEYYGASVWDPGRKKLTVGLIQEGRLAAIKSDAAADSLLPLKKMLETSRMYEHYNYGWALVHMLMNDKSRKKKFERFVMSLVKGKDVKRVAKGVGSMKTVEGPEVLRVFMKSLGIKDEAGLAKLEKEWHTYIREKLEVVSARGLEKAARDAVRTGRPIRGKRLYKEAIEAGGASALAHHRYAELLRDKGQKDEAVKHWRRAIEIDPLVADFYSALGRSLFDKGEKEEGRRLAKLAVEIDPEDIWLAHRVREMLEEK